MEHAFNTSVVLLAILYTLLVVAYARIFALGSGGLRPGGLGRHVRPLLVGTLSLHFASLFLWSIRVGACPLAGPPEFLSLVAFSIAVIYFVLELRMHERSTGVFALTPAFFLQLVAAVGILGSEGRPESKMGLLESWHAFAAIVGSSAVAITSVYGLLYLFLYAAIKRGRFGLFYQKMPPLEVLSSLNFVAAVVAFLAISITVGLGYFVPLEPQDKGVSFQHLEVILAWVLWALYGSCILARRYLRFGGKRLAYTTLLGLLPLAVIFIRGLLSRGFHG
jgi:HemX protein